MLPSAGAASSEELAAGCGMRPATVDFFFRAWKGK